MQGLRVQFIENLIFSKKYETCTVRVGADAHIGPGKVANLP